MTTDRAHAGSDRSSDGVADGVDDVVREHPWLETVGQVGWVAKGFVYLLFGAAATQIARQERTDNEASAEGALNRILEQPGGRVLLSVMAVGLVLYFLWRVLSVAVIRGSDLSDWAHRIGYGFSALFYVFLAFTAARTVMRGSESDGESTIEQVSRSLLDTGWGRVLVTVGGVATVVIGLVFVVHKGLMRSFTDDLHGADGSGDDALDRLIIAAGVAGWIGRGLVTILVGFFVARSAINFDPDDARGFDGALRQAATDPTGEILVWVSAVGLVLYGAFCVFSHRYRRIEDNT